jgi:hypothetical protein
MLENFCWSLIVKSFIRPSGPPLSFKACFFMLAMLTSLTPAHAVTWGFQNITDNSGIASAVGGQLAVDVQADGTTGASFTFSNSGPLASSITDIYFVNDPLLFGNGVTIVNGAGVSFSAGATPGGLPGGTPFGFAEGAVVFSADSDSPVQPNGVNPGESVTIILALLGGVDFDDVISALLAGTLQLGIHVQGINGDGSDSYIAATPLPGAIPLFATGLAALGLLRWRAKRKSIAR